MSNEQKENIALSPLLAGPNGAKPIPVRKITFQHGITVSVPGGDGAARLVVDSSIRDDGKPPQTNVVRHKIHYLPWLGMFHLATFRPSQFEPEGRPLLIPREWACWELA